LLAAPPLLPAAEPDKDIRAGLTDLALGTGAFDIGLSRSYPGVPNLDWRQFQSPAYYKAQAREAASQQRSWSIKRDEKETQDDKRDDNNDNNEKHDWFVVNPPSSKPVPCTPRRSVPEIIVSSPSPDGGAPLWLRAHLAPSPKQASPQNAEMDPEMLMPPSPSSRGQKKRRHGRKKGLQPSMEREPEPLPQPQVDDQPDGMSLEGAWDTLWTPSRPAPGVPPNEMPATGTEAWTDLVKQAIMKPQSGGSYPSVLRQNGRILHLEDVAEKGGVEPDSDDDMTG
jgi:hypothetical protein